MKRYIITFYILLFAIILINESITLSHAWDCYTYADGLIDNNVTTVAVNREIVLCGTRLGGSQFDGAHWKKFLEGVEITKIALTEDDHIWVGTRQGLLKGYEEKWTPKLSNVLIHDIVIEPEGKIWVATDNGILSSIDGINWESYAHLNEQLAQVGQRIAASLAEIPLPDLNWIKNYVIVIALKDKSKLYAGIHLTFGVGKGKDVLILSGIGSFDGHHWKLLEPTLEIRLLKFSETELLKQRDNFVENAFQVHRWKTLEAKRNSYLSWFFRRVRPITTVSVDKNDYIWYSRWNRGVFRFDGEHLTRYFSQDLDRNGFWDGEQEVLAAVDMDGDGQKEIVATANAGYDQEPRGIYVYDAKSGEKRWQYRIGPLIDAGVVAIGDVTGNSKLEVIAGGGSLNNGVEANGTDDSHGFLFILDHAGANLYGDGRSKPLTDEGGGLNVAIADMDGDGVNEIIGGITWNTYLSPKVTDAGIIIADGRGNVKHRYTHPTAFNEIGVANLDGQGNPEIIATDEEYLIQVFDANLSLLCEKQLPQYE